MLETGDRRLDRRSQASRAVRQEMVIVWIEDATVALIQLRTNQSVLSQRTYSDEGEDGGSGGAGGRKSGEMTKERS